MINKKREGQTVLMHIYSMYIKCHIFVLYVHVHNHREREREKDTHGHTEIQITKHKR